MGDQRSGVAQAIAAAGPLGLEPEAETIDLFGGDANAGSPIDESAHALGVSTARVAGRRGRPKGSRNATTEDVVRFLSANYRHPLLGLADIASTSPEQLAKLLAGSQFVNREDRWRAWQLHMTAAKELAEYMLPKQPRALTISAPDVAPLFNVFMGSPAAPGGLFGMIDQVQWGIPEMPAETGQSNPIGGEVLEAEVLETGKSTGNSNA